MLGRKHACLNCASGAQGIGIGVVMHRLRPTATLPPTGPAPRAVPIDLKRSPTYRSRMRATTPTTRWPPAGSSGAGAPFSRRCGSCRSAGAGRCRAAVRGRCRPPRQHQRILLRVSLEHALPHYLSHLTFTCDPEGRIGRQSTQRPKILARNPPPEALCSCACPEQRSARGTPRITASTCCPQPAHVVLPHWRQFTARHMFVTPEERRVISDSTIPPGV